MISQSDAPRRGDGEIDYPKWWDQWSWYNITAKCTVERLRAIIRGDSEDFQGAWTYLPDATLFKNWVIDGARMNSKNGVLWPGPIKLPGGNKHLAYVRPMVPGGDRNHEIYLACADKPEGPYRVIEKSYGPRRPGGELAGLAFDTGFAGTTGHPMTGTPIGHLNIPHFGDFNSDGKIYRLGMMAHDIKDPTQITYRSWLPLLFPERGYEFEGWVGNVVYCCGFVPDLENDRIRLYYGMADKYIGRATVKLVDNWRDLGKKDLADLEQQEIQQLTDIRDELDRIYREAA